MLILYRTCSVEYIITNLTAEAIYLYSYMFKSYKYMYYDETLYP